MVAKKVCAGLVAITLVFSNASYIFNAVDNTNTSIMAYAETTEGTYGVLKYTKYEDYIAITGCESSVTSVVVPDAIDGVRVTKIEDYAFSGCSSLSSVDLGNVTDLGYYLFNDCDSLKSITIPKTVTHASTYSLHGYSVWIDTSGPLADSSIETVIFEEGIEYIPSGICANARTVKNVTIPDNDVSDNYYIGGSAFFNTEIKEISLPNSLTSIGGSAFSSCYSLETVNWGTGLQKINGSAFRNCSNLVITTLPEGVTTIGEAAFLGCTSILELDLPNSVEYVGKNAFQDCTNLERFGLGCVKKLGVCVFYGCTSLESIVIPKTLEETEKLGYMGYDYYSGALASSGIKTIYFEDGIKKIPDYLCSETYSLENVVFPDSVEDIGYEAFALTSLKDVTIPKSMTTISSGAFIACNKLENVIISDNVTVIGGSAFRDCTSLNKITIPNSVTEIQGSAFMGCSSLNDVVIPDSVKSIGGHAFEDCEKLSNIDLGKVEELGARIFEDCSSLKEITIPNTVKKSYTQKDGWVAWAKKSGALGFSNIKTVYVEDGISELPDYIFSDSNIEEAILPDGLKRIGEGSFYQCSDLKSIDIPNTVEDIGNEAFRGCYNMSKLSLPDNLTSIGDSSFYNCSAITDIIIPESVSNIGKYAFNGCEKLESIILPDSLDALNDGVFDGCKNLAFIDMPDSVTSTCN